MPNCTYTKASEFRRAIRMFDTVHLKDNAIAMLKQQSRHAVSNALYQSKLPLSNNVHGANKMCPPETLHVLDAGITIYMMESLRLLLPGGKFRSELDDAHIRMAYNIKRQSERDLPRGSIRNGIIDTTRCQSSERRGNLFLLVCIAHTASGAQLLKKGLGYNNSRWKKWLRLLKYYLAMTDEWFHDCRPKEEVRNGRVAVAEVMKGIQVLFPRSQDSHGYNIPKMHALSKVVEYICKFGSAINFYSGPGEASHKLFVKAPGRKTQRRMHEFASQTAGQYYYIMAIKKASMFVDTRSTNEKISAERTTAVRGTNQPQFTMAGKYTIDLYPNNTSRIRSKKGSELERHGLDTCMMDALRRISSQRNDEDDSDSRDNSGYRFVGYTHASVTMDDGSVVNYNAHPFFHGASWYDWAYIHYVIEGEDGPIEQYYPSRILGFIEDDDDDEITAIVHCSERAVEWNELEEKIFVPFNLSNSAGNEQLVPLSSLLEPICVVPNYGNDDSYLMVLPKRQWSKYFTSLIREKSENM